MTGSTMRSSPSQPELIYSIARRVALSCDRWMAEVTPVWEKSTPTRQGPPVFSLKLMALTWTIALVRFERPYVRLQETQIARPREAGLRQRTRDLPASGLRRYAHLCTASLARRPW